MIKLQNTALKKLVSLPGGIALDITINAKRMEIPVVLPRGLRPLNIGASPSANSCTRRAQWFAQIVSEMRQDLENKNLPYPLLWWNKRSKSFYFIYPLVRSVPTLPPPQNPIAIGIDRGVRELAVLVALKDIRARPSLIRFFSGESLVELRRED